MRRLAAALALALAFTAACGSSGPLKSTVAAPADAKHISLDRGQPHWLDNATRKRSLAIMSFEENPVKVVIGFLDQGKTTPHTLGLDETLDVDGVTYRVSEINPAEDGYVVLTSK